ncbi:VWA domain-containing protein [Hymenobacter koreensis]|uniref:VWA domain-containing protein n=1 Tax=Hymenobacter koreensis TaxID=1084523 RepID=A0ABP8JHZ5_9BACT
MLLAALLPACVRQSAPTAVTTGAEQANPTAALAAALDSMSVAGRVTDRSNGQGLPGVTVLLKGTTTGISTNHDGSYQLRLPAGLTQGTLQISSVGYQMVEKPFRAGQRVNVALAADTKQLNEVVVTGGQPGAAPSIRIRGLATIRGDHKARKAMSADYYQQPPPQNRESYAHLPENGFQQVSKEPLSTFSIDVDPASYSNVRRYLQQEAQLPPADAVRTEELINYFTYNYPQPTTEAPAALHTEIARCPWAPAHQLVLVGVQARNVPTEKLPPANLTFLIDVSGSMQSADKLPLVKASLTQLVQRMRPQDRVSLVVYAGAAGLVLPPTPGTQRADILAALNRLEAGGSTAGGEGLRLAYATARQHFLKEGNNRVILCSDGDFNVGESSDDAMEHLITQERESGVFLSVLGFGTGNLQDSKMERLADKGNGNYAYIDNLDEGRRVLVKQFGGTLFTLAKDVKLQVEFNPARVQAYRLIGYENRLLAAEDFNNDKKDAGELGAGQQVTALYEVVPVGAPGLIDPLKYQAPAQATKVPATTEWLTVKMRYKEPQGQQSRLISQPLGGEGRPVQEASESLRWAAAVAQFGQLLHQSTQPGRGTYDSTLQLARAARGKDDDGYRAECIRLMETAAGLTPGAGSVGRR